MDLKELEKDPYFLVKIIGVIFLALLIALPVAMVARKASNPEDALTEERLAAFQSELELKEGTSLGQVIAANQGGGYSQRSEKYTNIGQAILTVNIYNITKLTGEEFKKIGETPWSLMNTVKGNLNTPQVIDIVFNNRNVIQAYMNRESMIKLGGSHTEALRIARLENFTLEKFVTNPTVEAVLQNPSLLETIMSSGLVKAILQTPSGQYFLKNPAEVTKIINEHEYLKKLLKNENLKNVLLKNPATSAAARQIYR